MKRWASIQTKIINSPATFFFCLYTYPVFASGVTYTSLSSISSWQCSCKIPSPLNWISCNQLKCNMISNCLAAGQNLTEVHHRHEQLAVSPNLLETKSLSEPKICWRFNKNTFSTKQPYSVTKLFSLLDYELHLVFQQQCVPTKRNKQ